MNAVARRAALRVAFIGLGHMGGPMASRLLGAGFEVRVHDRAPAALDAFAATAGSIRCATPDDAARDADVVIAMLPGDGPVAEAFLGSDGQAGAANVVADGALLVDMGTTAPQATLRIAAEAGAAAARRGHTLHYLDAPVMGGVPFARDGTLEILVGGDATALERLRPLLEAMGRSFRHCGPIGSAHALKAIANFVNAATLTVWSEALALGRAAGLKTGFMVEAMTTLCTGRQHPLPKKIEPHVVTRRFASGMSMGLTAKDLGIAAALVHGDDGASVARPLHAIWEDAVRRHGASADQTEIVRVFEEAASVRV